MEAPAERSQTTAARPITTTTIAPMKPAPGRRVARRTARAIVPTMMRATALTLRVVSRSRPGGNAGRATASSTAKRTGCASSYSSMVRLRVLRQLRRPDHESEARGFCGGLPVERGVWCAAFQRRLPRPARRRNRFAELPKRTDGLSLSPSSLCSRRAPAGRSGSSGGPRSASRTSRRSARGASPGPLRGLQHESRLSQTDTERVGGRRSTTHSPR